MFFQRIYYICFRFCSRFCFWFVLIALVFIVLVLVSILQLMLRGMSRGILFLSFFSLWYAFFLLFLRFRMARGILFSHLSLSGMPFACFSHSFGCSGAYFSLFFHSLVCLFLAFHALSNVLGHTFSFSFISGMSILQFLKHMLK